ncbi:MAG: hypothetical protein A49_14950 [Methyloceanibacter sp.]|nr:MAG: hypothetical protein A49_14950 [Methyloceanibacter sp.]
MGHPRDLASREGRPTRLTADPAVFDDALRLEVDDRKVRVVTHGDAALAGDPEQALGARAGEIDESGKAQAPRIHVIEHDRHERLHAGHAGRCRGIDGRLLFEGVRRVVRSQNVDDALLQSPPQKVPMRPVPDRRVLLNLRPKPLIVFGAGKRQMLRRHLYRGDVLMVRQQFHLGARRDMQDMDARARARASRKRRRVDSSAAASSRHS